MKKYLTIPFLILETILYILILTTGGQLLVLSSFISILLCFLYSLFAGNNDLMKAGLFFTVCADFCLVVCTPIQQLWGMVFFTFTQSFYAAMLQRSSPNRMILTIRLGLTAIAAVIACIILKEKTDALALVSVCYYANLIMNFVESCTQFRFRKLLSVAFLLFILCDTVIGLQVASGSYLPIGEDSLIYRIIFSGFHLSWFFYLPSQVLLALSSKEKA